MGNITVGIPRAFLYHKYKYLWVAFFRGLGVEVVLSPESNGSILNDGISAAVDECCLPAKLYLGHINGLKDKCDCILIPRIKSFGKKDSVCVIFNAMYDIVKNIYGNIEILDYDIDYKNGHGEMNGFISMGGRLGFSKGKTLDAYLAAKEIERKYNASMNEKQLDALNGEGVKILAVSHPYNIYDKLIGYPVIRYITKLGGTVIYANECDGGLCAKKSENLAKTLYWTYSKELIGAVELYKDKVDGIVFISAFPCGPDSLINELILRKLKKPMLNLIVDELNSQSGLETRLESYMDILTEKVRAR